MIGIQGLAQENINFKTKGLLSEIPRQNTGIKKSLRSYQPVGSLSRGNRFKTILSRLHINGKGRSCWKIFYGVSIDQSNQGNRHCILIFKRQPSYVLGDFYYSSSYADVLLPLLVSVLWFWKYFWNIRESQLCFIKEGWIVWTILLKLLRLKHFNFCLFAKTIKLCQCLRQIWCLVFFLPPFLLNKTYFNINL